MRSSHEKAMAMERMAPSDSLVGALAKKRQACGTPRSTADQPASY
jgi:hypothetical protein